jgi:ADP-ribose pyrophosphatase YjhB (NUDIX family)
MMNWQSLVRRRIVTAWGYLPLPGWLRSLILWTVLPKFLVGAVAVIFHEQDGILLFRHTYRAECPWGLPSGWLKTGEHAHEALERELFEESGYRIRVKRSVVVGGDRKNRRLDLYYECELIDGTFRPSAEVCEARFFPLDALPSCLEPFHRHVITYTACHPDRSICESETT